MNSCTRVPSGDHNSRPPRPTLLLGLRGGGYEIAMRQQTGYGAMLSFELEGGLSAVFRFVEALEVFTPAESLGVSKAWSDIQPP